MKIVVLSFDDGTIYDERFIGLLNKYKLPATLNLNSRLNDYVWYLDNIPIKRLNLYNSKELYNGMEVSSHTCTHPYLTDLDKSSLIKEINEDVDNLKEIFNREITSFAVPMDRCNEEIVDIIKNNTPIKAIRLPLLTKEYLPRDSYHIGCNAWYDQDNIYDLLNDFINNPLKNSLFVIVGHSYEFMVKNNWDTIENLLKYLSSNKDITVMTMSDAVNVLFNK